MAGTFNDWNAAAHPLRRPTGGGPWEAVLLLEPGDHAYQFVVDGDRWIGGESAADPEDDGFGGRNARFSVGEEPLVVGP